MGAEVQPACFSLRNSVVYCLVLYSHPRDDLVRFLTFDIFGAVGGSRRGQPKGEESASSTSTTHGRGSMKSWPHGKESEDGLGSTHGRGGTTARQHGEASECGRSTTRGWGGTIDPIGNQPATELCSQRIYNSDSEDLLVELRPGRTFPQRVPPCNPEYRTVQKVQLSIKPPRLFHLEKQVL